MCKKSRRSELQTEWATDGVSCRRSRVHTEWATDGVIFLSGNWLLKWQLKLYLWQLIIKALFMYKVPVFLLISSIFYIPTCNHQTLHYNAQYLPMNNVSSRSTFPPPVQITNRDVLVFTATLLPVRSHFLPLCVVISAVQ